MWTLPTPPRRESSALSVFGIMNGSSEREILILLMDLVLLGYLEASHQGLEERLLITAKGAELLKGKQQLVQMVLAD